jgi:2-polyprenyl-3-methyl-5-hydroxy-6-metoxy-1,4-benzoquinol methylase
MAYDDAAYTERLKGVRWKQVLNTQAPYKWNLRRLDLGHVLDVGCGIGRNLGHLDGNGVGVDVSPTSIAEARARGFTAYTAEEFPTCADAKPERYDSLLFAHVLEHMTHNQAVSLVGTYLPYLRHGGTVVIIVPQQAGFASDPTHVEFVDRVGLGRIEAAHRLESVRLYSFPFPPVVGKVFLHNETIALSRKP